MSNKIKIFYGENHSQFGVLRVPQSKSPSPVIVTIHGGFWQEKENNPIAEDLTRKGYATWNIEYRRLGERGGGWPGTFDDVIDAVNHLTNIKETHRLDLTNVIIIGHSAGGHLALWLASRALHRNTDNIFKDLEVPIRKVISLAGVTDLKKMLEIHDEKGIKSPVTELMGGTPREVPERYKLASPIELLPMDVEQVLVHGELDQHVSVELSKDYYNKAIEQQDHVKLVVLPEIEHFKIIDPSSTAWNSVIDIF
ncbi:alpha/beta hydrolase [Halalkalibacillus sediminis]|uniref:Alpha/beta hydrolase n=1 Tax=Halalkalibacillus sediminis TaxID=2018042 RepID=A0A2I0QWN7_9BACI|nr:alpha/beta hydrolase [Halalkalibacillus sediminis]PKR78756.1 alpha/beta hydrolase [Halalkalibacillus sediminis]